MYIYRGYKKAQANMFLGCTWVEDEAYVEAEACVNYCIKQVGRHSLDYSSSLSLAITLSFSLPLCHSRSLTLTLSLSHIFTYSDSLSRSLSYTLSLFSYTLCLPLILSLSPSHSLSPSPSLSPSHSLSHSFAHTLSISHTPFLKTHGLGDLLVPSMISEQTVRFRHTCSGLKEVLLLGCGR